MRMRNSRTMHRPECHIQVSVTSILCKCPEGRQTWYDLINWCTFPVVVHAFTVGVSCLTNILLLLYEKAAQLEGHLVRVCYLKLSKIFGSVTHSHSGCRMKELKTMEIATNILFRRTLSLRFFGYKEFLTDMKIDTLYGLVQESTFFFSLQKDLRKKHVKSKLLFADYVKVEDVELQKARLHK